MGNGRHLLGGFHSGSPRSRLFRAGPRPLKRVKTVDRATGELVNLPALEG